MKSYTDLEQSKKLAEILPLESADSHYVRNTHDYMGNPVDGKWSHPKYGNPNSRYANYIVQNFSSYETIPCWSLAALLDVLPPYLFEFKRGIDLNVYPNLNGKGWHCSYMPNCIENIEKDKFKLITSEDSLVDACYEMIIKLNEQKLL